MDKVDIGFSITKEQISTSDMQAWSDEKKDAFCQTFEAQSYDARQILVMVADSIVSLAAARYFIPQNPVFRDRLQADRVKVERFGSSTRSMDELSRVAQQQAKDILDNLPSSRDAVAVIDMETAKKMDRREKIEEQLTALLEEYSNLDMEIDIDDVPQDWTVKRFKDHVKAEIKKREALLQKIEKLNDEGSTLQREISKKLYKGLPGLKEAVSKVVQAHYEKAVHLGTLTRQITQQVRFGDSAEAMKILGLFESNELEVSASVKAEFATAMKTLVPKTSRRSTKKTTKKARASA